MTRGLYVFGGAGAGKSTFTRALVALGGMVVEPYIVVHEKPDSQKNNVAWLHPLRLPDGRAGAYLGRGGLDGPHPGTDTLARSCSVAFVPWLAEGAGTQPLPLFIVGEGMNLSTRPWFTAMAENTEFLAVHVFADPWVTEVRRWQRMQAMLEDTSVRAIFDDGRPKDQMQSDTFAQASATRGENLEAWCRKAGVPVLRVDGADTDEWGAGLHAALAHLLSPSDLL